MLSNITQLGNQIDVSIKAQQVPTLSVIALSNVSENLKTSVYHIYETAVNKVLMQNPKNEYNADDESCLALGILSDTENKEIIQEICLLLLDQIKKITPVQQGVLDFRLDDDVAFPIYKYHTQFSSIEDEIRFLSKMELKEDYIVCAMCRLWIIGQYIGEFLIPKKSKAIETIYNEYICKYAKNHKISDDFLYIEKNKLGNSDIESELLNNLHPLYKLSSRVEFIPDDFDKKPFLKKYQDSKYLSGMSGMSNAFYNIYPLLGIEYESEVGKRLKDIVAAFIVSIGFHTFAECFDSLDFTHEHLKQLNNEDSITNMRIRLRDSICKKMRMQYSDGLEMIADFRFKKDCNFRNYQCLSNKYKYRKENVLLILSYYSDVYLSLPNELKNDYDIAMAAVKKNPKIFFSLSDEIKKNHDIAMCVLDVMPKMYKYFPDQLKNNRDIAMLAVKKDPNIYLSLPNELKNDHDIAMLAIKKDPNIYLSLPIELKNDRDIAMTAVRDLPSLLIKISEKEIKTTLYDEVAKCGVALAGTLYRYLPMRLKCQKEMALIAVKSTTVAYADLLEKFKSDLEIVEIAKKIKA